MRYNRTIGHNKRTIAIIPATINSFLYPSMLTSATHTFQYPLLSRFPSRNALQSSLFLDWCESSSFCGITRIGTFSSATPNGLLLKGCIFVQIYHPSMWGFNATHDTPFYGAGVPGESDNRPVVPLINRTFEQCV